MAGGVGGKAREGLPIPSIEVLIKEIILKFEVYIL